MTVLTLPPPAVTTDTTGVGVHVEVDMVELCELLALVVLAAAVVCEVLYTIVSAVRGRTNESLPAYSLSS